MILRLIFWLIVFYVVFKVIRLVLFPPIQGRRPGAGLPRDSSHSSTPLTACPACGTFFQERQGVTAAGRVYCCADCARKA